MRIRVFILASAVAILGTSGAEAKRGISMKGLFGSSKGTTAPAASVAKPVTPAAAAKPAVPPSPPAPAAAASTAPATQTAPRSSNSFIFVSTGGSRPANAATEKKEDGRIRNEQLPISEAATSVGDSATAPVKPAGYKAPVLGGSTMANQTSSAPGFKQIN